MDGVLAQFVTLEVVVEEVLLDHIGHVLGLRLRELEMQRPLVTLVLDLDAAILLVANHQLLLVGSVNVLVVVAEDVSRINQATRSLPTHLALVPTLHRRIEPRQRKLNLLWHVHHL